MNIQEYIESGILEQYVLGTLTLREQTEVERLADAHTEIRQELDQITQALEGYALAHAAAPPAGMRERVLAGWQAAIQLEAPVAATPPVAEPGRVIAMPASEEPARTSGRALTWLMAAAVALLLISNFIFYRNWQNASQELTAMQSSRDELAANTRVVQERLTQRTNELAMFRDDAYHTVQLNGTPNAPGAKARVHFNPTTKAVYVEVRNLPKPPEGKQYQLWALDNGKPIDAGMLAEATMTGDSVQLMKSIASAQAFAMTVEPAGGSASPTLSSMAVLGNMN
ncbi:anti-sigma factor [Hymenobacter sp. BT730]|uniref:anti-sigma factor n=1 Tax=Hymenobacter sp. BT730 TaxID=3063332 RepID=UPI0026E0FB29|nr:anti-sigma factor [Hymenobacter sp. BT730]